MTATLHWINAPASGPTGLGLVRKHGHRIGAVARFLVLCAALVVPAASWANGLVVEGSQLPWTAEFPGFWIGGTAQSMERVLARTVGDDRVSQDIRTLLSEMLPEAKALDALLFHMDATGAETNTPSSLRVSVVPGRFERLAEDSYRKSVMESLSQHRLEAYPPGTKAEVTEHRVSVTAGREAYEGIFLFALPSGGKVYEVQHLVTYDLGLTHRFALRADSAKFAARYADLRAILSSLKYVFGGGQLPWRAELPAGWTGGNAAFLERASTMTSEEGSRSLLSKMLTEARTLDAFLLHFDASEEAISSLRVDVTELGINFADPSSRQPFWEDYSKRVAKRHPQGSSIVVLPEHTANTGGRDAYETEYRVTLPEGGKVHYVLHAVPLDAEKTHLFLFKTGSSRFDSRYSELRTILASLKYAVESTVE